MLRFQLKCVCTHILAFLKKPHLKISNSRELFAKIMLAGQDDSLNTEFARLMSLMYLYSQHLVEPRSLLLLFSLVETRNQKGCGVDSWENAAVWAPNVGTSKLLA